MEPTAGGIDGGEIAFQLKYAPGRSGRDDLLNTPGI